MSLYLTTTRKELIRKSFSKGEYYEISLPNLIEVQSKSFNDFVQLDLLPAERERIGLEKIFRDTFPIEHAGKISLEYVSYELGEWSCICRALTGLQTRYKWTCSSCPETGISRLQKGQKCNECKKGELSYIRCKQCCSRVFVQMPVSLEKTRYAGKTYSMPLKVRLQLITWDILEDGSRVIRDIKEQDVFFCDLPMMVELFQDEEGSYRVGSRGTFLINGVDRVVVSQLHRAPGVLFSLSKKTKDYRGQPSHIARIIPARGAWLDFEFDQNDILFARIDKKKKFLATTLLQALGIERKKILSQFYAFEEIFVKDGEFFKSVGEHLIGQRFDASIVMDEELSKNFFVGQRITDVVLKKLVSLNVKSLRLKQTSLINRVVAEDITDKATGEVLVQEGHSLSEDVVSYLNKQREFSLRLIQASGYAFQASIALTLAQDSASTKEEAVKLLYAILRPGDVPAYKAMEEYIEELFFNVRYYDLTAAGRARINRKLGFSDNFKNLQLTLEDIVAVIRYAVFLKEKGEGELDDVDNLKNRCVRLVGELLQGQMYVGFSRIEKIARERFRLQETHVSHMPYDYINVKPLVAILREFFGTGQLSQFMDQTNPLSEMAHKRRLSALGPGGVSRERATLDVRDVHPSHYGRICPIETPEGQNIGLISSLATYARVNEMGFIETAFRPVVDGFVKKEIVYLDAFEESGSCVAQATESLDKDGKLLAKVLLGRRADGNIEQVQPEEVDYLDASPRQVVSVATALIPFLEHDDANRALMGSNMQRQAVPLLKPVPPLVGTGTECEVGSSEGTVISAVSDGVVKYVSAEKIVIRKTEVNEQDWFAQPIDTYFLKKFGRSSHNTWVHHTPIVKVGDEVRKGDVLTNGPATCNGELALGSNLLVAFMPWHGFNYEDAIVISKRLVSDDVFTSIHVEEFVAEARETKVGAEEITKDIPNVSDRELKALDIDGIVKVGTRVRPGDILVGKVTLKGDAPVSPEEKLLKAIFHEKSREVRDTSLRVPPGVEGTVVDVKIFSRSGIRNDERYKRIVADETRKIEEQMACHLSILSSAIREKLLDAFEQKGAFPIKELSKISTASLEELFAIKSKDKKIQARIDYFADLYSSQIRVLESLKAEEISKLRKGDSLASGVIKMVRVYVAMKRTISVGDKIAGRHGNKGVISRVVNLEDMPFLPDGRAVDIVLNPLGVPGRMNVGQLLETVMGMCCKEVGEKVFQDIENASYAQVKQKLASYYGKESVELLESQGGQERVMACAKFTAKHGLFVKVPIFESPSYEDTIRPLLKQLSLPQTGTYKLRNGETGDYFDQEIMVGQLYMMKLNHLADDKLHARSVGPYSLITQQPLGGKAQFGGQRLGEMEVWALYGYGAAQTLREMFTVKSDDTAGRTKAYDAIVRGDEVPDPGMPESFNVLVKELQTLGLQVDLYRAIKEQASE